jgi:hypothetical protein
MAINALSDVLQYRVFPSLEVRDILHLSSVCRGWCQIIISNEFWQDVSIRKGFPLVEGEGRNRRADFQILYKMAGVSQRTINRCSGEMVGVMPRIKKERFEWLFEQDRWAPAPRLNHETFQWDVVPSHIRRATGPEVSLSLKNLKTRTENQFIFSKHCVNEAFDQSEPVPQGVQIWFSRKEVVSTELEWNDQQVSVENKGEQYVVMDLFPLAWRECHRILETGSSLLDRNSIAYARTSTLGHFNHGDYHLCIGGHKLGKGLTIALCYDDLDTDEAGVIPGVLAGEWKPVNPH